MTSDLPLFGLLIPHDTPIFAGSNHPQNGNAPGIVCISSVPMSIMSPSEVDISR